MRWWSQVLDDFVVPQDEEQGPDDEECGLEGPQGQWMLWLKVPDRDRDAEVERVLALGATMVNDMREGPKRGWAVLADPEGNEFCILRQAGD